MERRHGGWTAGARWLGGASWAGGRGGAGGRPLVCLSGFRSARTPFRNSYRCRPKPLRKETIIDLPPRILSQLNTIILW